MFRRLLHVLEFAVVWAVVALLRMLPERSALALARDIGRAAYRVLAFDRRWAHRNLELIFGPHLTAGQRTRIAIRSFENVAVSRAELLRCTPEWLDGHCELRGAEDAVARHRAGRGAIVATVHLGNFELVAAGCARHGLRGPTVYRPQDNPLVERMLAAARDRYMSVPPVPRVPLVTLHLAHDLRAGGGVGMAIDINTLDDPVWVDFLGIGAASPRGPAALALTTGSMIVPVVAVRTERGRHLVRVLPVIEPRPGRDRRADIAALTAELHAAFEPWILAYPEQYNWPHPRWRFRPGRVFWRVDDPVDDQSGDRIRGPLRPWQINPAGEPVAPQAD